MLRPPQRLRLKDPVRSSGVHRSCAPKDKLLGRMCFDQFQRRLTDIGFGWLSMEHQRVLFNTLDADGSGIISEAEIYDLADRRANLELHEE